MILQLKANKYLGVAIETGKTFVNFDFRGMIKTHRADTCARKIVENVRLNILAFRRFNMIILILAITENKVF